MSGTTFRKLRLFGDVNLVLELNAGFKPVSPDGEVITTTTTGRKETRYFTFEWNSQTDERSIYSISQMQNFLEEYLYGTTRIPFLQNAEVEVKVYPKALNVRPKRITTLSSLFPRFSPRSSWGEPPSYWAKYA